MPTFVPYQKNSEWKFDQDFLSAFSSCKIDHGSFFWSDICKTMLKRDSWYGIVIGECDKFQFCEFCDSFCCTGIITSSYFVSIRFVVVCHGNDFSCLQSLVRSLIQAWRIFVGQLYQVFLRVLVVTTIQLRVLKLIQILTILKKYLLAYFPQGLTIFSNPPFGFTS